MSVDQTLDEKEIKHQRRPRYKGTHPKNFKEKYKELNPEKYADDIEKIIKKICKKYKKNYKKRQHSCRYAYFHLR